jgi:hypothetical protein
MGLSGGGCMFYSKRKTGYQVRYQNDGQNIQYLRDFPHKIHVLDNPPIVSSIHENKTPSCPKTFEMAQSF